MISKSFSTLAALGLLTFGLAPALGAERVVWQIGKSDKSYDDLAIARNYPAFQERFGRQPLVFEIGRSEAARDWPFIQTGNRRCLGWQPGAPVYHPIPTRRSATWLVHLAH